MNGVRSLSSALFTLKITFCSFLFTVHHFLCAFSAKTATYSLFIDNVYFLISS